MRLDRDCDGPTLTSELSPEAAQIASVRRGVASLVANGRYREARTQLEALIRERWDTRDRDTADQLGQAKVSLAAQLELDGVTTAALDLLVEASADLEGISPSSSPNGAIRALLLQGRYLARLGHRQEALVPLDRLICRADQDGRLAVQRKVALALLTKIQLLTELDRADDALSACDKLSSQFGSSDDEKISNSVTGGLVFGADLLGRSDRKLEAIEMWSEIVDRARVFAAPTSPLLQWEAMSQRAATLAAVGQIDRAQGDLQAIIEGLSGDSRLESLALVAEAHARRADLAFTTEDWELGISKLEAAVTQFADVVAEAPMRDRVLESVLLWVAVLLRCDRDDDARACAALLEQILSSENERAGFVGVAERVFEGARRFHAHGDLKTALELLTTTATGIADAREAGDLRFRVQLNRAVVLARLDRIADASEALEDIFGPGATALTAAERSRRSSDPARRTDLAYAMFAQVVLLLREGKTAQATSIRDEYFALFNVVADGPIHEITEAVRAIGRGADEGLHPAA